MTAPVQVIQTEQDLIQQLQLVDESRAQSMTVEDQLVAGMQQLYPLVVTEQVEEDEADDPSPILTAVLLTAAVALLRRAWGFGLEEGTSFAQKQLDVLGISAPSEIDIPESDIIDKLVKDFLAGQVAVVKTGGNRDIVLTELRRRAVLAVVSAVQSGRGVATELVFASVVESLGSEVHKLWVARFDLLTPPCGLCLRLHGVHVPLGEPFPVPASEPAPYLGKLEGPARHPNCRCSLLIIFPDQISLSGSGASPTSMRAYADWFLRASEKDRSQYLAATIVHVGAYTRVVNGRVQQVSGYYYDIQSGMKIPESAAQGLNVKSVSAKQAKAMAAKSKAANKATPKGGAPNLDWKPGTYKVDLPGNDDTQVVVHQDGSSTAVHKGKTEDVEKAATDQFLTLHAQHGNVTKISDDPNVPDPKGPGPLLEPSPETKKQSTLPEGHYMTPDHKDYGGVEVKPDGTGILHSKDFTKKTPLKQTAVKQIANGHLGETHEVDPKDFKSDWHKSFDGGSASKKDDGGSSSSGSASASDGSASASEGDVGSASAKEGHVSEGDAGSASVKGGHVSEGDAGSASVKEGDAGSVAVHEKGGHGDAVSGGPSLFSVGDHSIQIDEGSQVYKSGKSKDTLYVLHSNGDLIKYNPQGAGVQAVKIGGPDNPNARAQQIAKLNNVSLDGDSIKDSMSPPGTGKTLVGGFDMTSGQLQNAIHALESNPSGNVAGDLKKVGSPLATGNFHAVAAPFKAYHNNKTKPALIHALKDALGLTGSTPKSEASAVAHLEENHGLKDHQGSLGHADHEAIHSALHAIDPEASGHSHKNNGPGFISVDGVPYPPSAISAALDALTNSPKNETGVKKPLKAAGSPLANADFQGLANASSVTDAFKGGIGKVHYGKLKPASIALLQDALDKHQTSHPASPLPSVPTPEPTKNVWGVQATQAHILEMQKFFDGIDMSTDTGWKQKLKEMSSNPLALGLQWDLVSGDKIGSPVPGHEKNSNIHKELNKHLDSLNPSPITSVGPAPKVADTSAKVNLPGVPEGTLNQLKQYKNLVDAESAQSEGHTVQVKGNEFSKAGPGTMLKALGAPVPEDPQGMKAALSDAVQKKIDSVTFHADNPPKAPTAPGHLVIGGQKVTKQDLVDAANAVKNSPATGVKGPLKDINSPLSKVDIKSYIESDPLSAPFKGGNGKVHYGKLKDAVATVLQAKADEMGSTPTLPDVPEATAPKSAITEVSGTSSKKLAGIIESAKAAPTLKKTEGFPAYFQQSVKTNTDVTFTDGDVLDVNAPEYEFYPDGSVIKHQGESFAPLSEQEIVSKLGAHFAPESKPSPGIEADTAKHAEPNVAEPGVYTAPGLGDMSLVVNPDGSGYMKNSSDNSKIDIKEDHIKQALAGGTWSKISDTPEDNGNPSVNGVEVGHYPDPFGAVTVYPDGTVLIQSLYGDALTHVNVAKPHIQAMGKSPTSEKVDVPSWMKGALKDPNGHLIGDYTDSDGHSFSIGPDEPFLSPESLAADLMSGSTHYQEYSASYEADKPEVNVPDPAQQKLDDLVAKAKKAGYQDAWDTNTTPLSVGFQQSIKFGKNIYVAGKNTYDNPPTVQHYKFTPDGHMQSIDGNGKVLKDFSPETIVKQFDSAFDGPPVSEPIPLPKDPEAFTPNLPSNTVEIPAVNVPGNIDFSVQDKPTLLYKVGKLAEKAPNPQAVGLHMATQSKADVLAWLNHWTNGEWDKAYAIEASKVKSHKGKFLHPGSPLNPDNKNGFTKKTVAPAIPGELPAGKLPPGVWPEGAVSKYSGWDEDTVNAYMYHANMQNPTGLTSHHKTLWVSKHKIGDQYNTNSLSTLGQKNVKEGNIYSKPLTAPIPTYGPGQAVPLPFDFPKIDLSKKAAVNLDDHNVNLYLDQIGTPKVGSFLKKQSLETKQELVSLHAVAAAAPGDTTFKDPAVAKKQLTDLLTSIKSSSHWTADVPQELMYSVLGEGANKTFTKDAKQPPLAGHSTLYHVSDENGNPYLFKVAPEPFRAEIEHAAHQLAKLSGIQVAGSELGKFEGQFGQFQAKVPSQSTLKGVSPTTLPVSALKNLMQAHVQDYVTSNDDAHDDNFLLSPDGKHVIPIDIARAFVRFGQPGAVSLKQGQLSNWEQPYYQKVYDAVLAKKLPDSSIDELYRASMNQARKTAAVSDKSWSDAMDVGLKNRTNFGMTSAKNKDDLIKQALARKNGLEGEFQKFWDDIYSKLGREKPAQGSDLSKWVHSGFTPEHLAHAEEMGNHGAATFFAGAMLEDGHLLSQVINKKDGSGKELHISGQLLKNADGDFRAWLEANVTGGLSGATPTTSKPNPEQKFLSDAGLTHFPSAILAAGKTVSHHNKLGDKNYNTMHMEKFEALKAELEKKQNELNGAKVPTAFKNWPEAQQEYSNALDFYEGQIKKVDDLRATNGQSKIGDFSDYKPTVPADKVIDIPIDLNKNKSIKVVKKHSSFENSDLGPDGKLTLNGKNSTEGQTGHMYEITLPDGTVINYKSWHPHSGVSKAQQGQLSIKVRNYDGTPTAANEARAALSGMNLDLKDATQDDLQLQYWRSLYGTMGQRSDGKQGIYGDIDKFVAAEIPGGAAGTPAMSVQEELSKWHEAWSRLDKTKFNTFLHEQRYMPRFGRVNPAAPQLFGGQPYWKRFDIDEEWIRQQSFPTHALSNPSIAPLLVKSGGLLSTENRMQLLGRFIGGMSSEADQHHGSSNFVFTRLNGVSPHAQIMLSPEVLARTSNYGYHGDNFGEIDSKKTSAHFNMKKQLSHDGSKNETLIKNTVSLLDDIEMITFANQADRQEAIAYLHSHGVTEIRGLPIEDRLVLPANRAAALHKIKEHRLTWKSEDDQ